jgi:hypothetical protein
MRTTPRRPSSTAVVPAALAGIFVSLVACGKHATLDECQALYDRYLDLKVAEDPRSKSMTPEERAAARKALEPAVASDSDVQQVTKQCETEVSREEYECAIRATTSRAWNDCIY